MWHNEEENCVREDGTQKKNPEENKEKNIGNGIAKQTNKKA